MGSHSSQRVPASVSPSTPAPQVRLAAWVMVLSGERLYFWNRCTGESRWTMEDGYSPSWLLRPDGRYVRLGDGEVFETLVTWLWVRSVSCSDVGSTVDTWFASAPGCLFCIVLPFYAKGNLDPEVVSVCSLVCWSASPAHGECAQLVLQLPSEAVVALGFGHYYH